MTRIARPRRPTVTRCLLVAGAALLAAGPVDASRGLVVVSGATRAQLHAVHAELEASGARLPHVVPPDVLVGDVTPEAVAALAPRDGIVVRLLRPDLGDTAPDAESSAGARAAWRLLTGATAAPAGLPAGGSPPDVVEPTEAERIEWAQPKALDVGDPSCGRPLATSAFLAGRVAVGIFLPESTGPVENSEDWTTEDPAFPMTPRTDVVLAEILEGADELVAALPAAELTFVYDFRPAVPIELEPIEHPVGARSRWIGQVMEAVGYGARAEVSGVRGYLDDLREADDTDWALAAFVVDDLEDADNGFPPTGFPFAYALLGGPYLVMTYDNDGWGVERMNVVFRHEVGHCFRALDEYSAAGNDCSMTAGYLRVPNGNNQSPPSDTACESSVECTMRANSTTAFCDFSRGQLGVRDTDGDGILDVRDAPPETVLDDTGLVLLETDAVTLEGTVRALSRADESPHAPATWTINRVAGAEVRVDGSPWTPLAPADGSWGDRCERVEIPLAGLSEGFHVVEVRGTNDVGLVEPSPASLTLYVNTDCADDAFEPDDDEASATPRLAGVHPDLVLCAVDADWSAFHLQAGADVAAAATFDPAAGALDVTLLDPLGRELARGTRGAGSVGLAATAERSGVHHLVVDGEGETETPYELRIDAACLEDVEEPNDTAAAAGEIAPGVRTGLVLCPATLDHYRIALQAGETLDVSIAFDGALGDLDLEVLDPSGTGAGLSDGTGDVESVSVTPTEEGVHVVRVLGKTAADRGLYELAVAATGCVDDVAEPDDDAASAAPVAAGDDLRRRACGEDEDWFAFDVAAPRFLRARLDWNAADGALALDLRDETGAAVLGIAGGEPGALAVQRDRLRPGSYRLRVTSPDASDVSYRLRLDVEDPVLLMARRDPPQLVPGTDVVLSWNDAGQECYTLRRSEDPSDFSGALERLIQEGEGEDTDLSIEDLEHRDEGVVRDGRPLYCYLVDPHDCGSSLVGSIKTADPYPVSVPGVGTLSEILFEITAVNEGTEDAFDVEIVDDMPWNVVGFRVLEIPAGAIDESQPAPAGANGTGLVSVRSVTVPAGGAAIVRFAVTPARNASDGPIIVSNQARLTAPSGTSGNRTSDVTDDPATHAFPDDTRVLHAVNWQDLRVIAFWHQRVDVDLRVIDSCGNAISESELRSVECDTVFADLRWANCRSPGFPDRSEWVGWSRFPPPGTYRVEVAYRASQWEDGDCLGHGPEEVTVVLQTPEGEVRYRTLVLEPDSGWVHVFDLERP